MACMHCDTLYRESSLSRGEKALCRRCGQVLHRGRESDPDVTFALAITALVMFGFANAYPVVFVEVQGQHSSATVWQAVTAMGNGYSMPAAFVVGVSMILLPLLQIGLLAWLAGYARLGRRAPAFTVAMRLIELARPWSMVEVFLLAALVAIVKLGSYAEVRPGIGLVALLGLTMLITWLAGRSTRELWRQTATEPRAYEHSDAVKPA